MRLNNSYIQFHILTGIWDVKNIFIESKQFVFGKFKPQIYFFLLTKRPSKLNQYEIWNIFFKMSILTLKLAILFCPALIGNVLINWHADGRYHFQNLNKLTSIKIWQFNRISCLKSIFWVWVLNVSEIRNILSISENGCVLASIVVYIFYGSYFIQKQFNVQC